jgi:signal transduction histidine kinase
MERRFVTTDARGAGCTPPRKVRTWAGAVGRRAALMKGGVSRRVVAGWVITLVGLAVATAGLLPSRSPSTTATPAMVLLVPVVIGVAVGGFPAVPVGVVAGFLIFSYFFVPTYDSFHITNSQDWASLCVYAGVACTVGAVVARFERAKRETEARRREVAVLLEEQEALRRVATLVAHGVAPSAVFDAVTAEVSRLLGADGSVLLAYEPDRTAVVVAGHAEPGVELRVGVRLDLDGQNVAAMVLGSGQAARMDDYAVRATGALAAQTVPQGIQAGVGAPIVVEGRVWGAVIAFTRTGFPAGIEQRMAQFTELAGTAIANADSRAELTASRARVVSAADDTRRRLERDLHDGIQQRLVSLALGLRNVEAAVPPAEVDLAARVAEIAEGLTAAVEDLQETARGIHPAILARGLVPALRTLAIRSAVPVELDARLDGRLPDPVEVAVYYVVSEALTNAAKHSGASVVRVDLHADTENVSVTVADDGAGGADLRGGSGLVGLKDRVEAFGGRIDVASPVGGGTTISATVPVGPVPSSAA